MTDKIYDLIIIGAGPAGMTAGIYAKRYMLDCMVVGPEVGGIATEAHDIENWPGFKGTGMELMTKFKDHLLSFDVPLVQDAVIEVSKEGDTFSVKTEKEEFKGKTIILALGTKRRKLNIPGENEFFGKGVSYCATCDCVFYKDKVVAVAGGGNAAAMAAQILSQHASKVYMIYRRSREKMKAEPARIRHIDEDPKIELMNNLNIVEVLGDKVVEKIKLDDGHELDVDGFFIEIGGIPATAMAKELGVELAKNDTIKVNDAMETNVPGVFAAGDVTTGSHGFHQIVTAAAEGSIAALGAFNYKLKHEED